MRKRNIVFLILCMAIGFSITVQAKTTMGQHIYVSGKVLSDYKTSIDSELVEMGKIKALTTEIRDKLYIYETDESAADAVWAKVQEEYNTLKMASGGMDLVGEGVKITLNDGIRELENWEDANGIIVHDLDVLTVLNELIRADAEAISINGQRLISTSEVSCSGHSVRINNQFFAQPFLIEAIGDKDVLEATLTAPGSYGELLKEYGLIFNVEKSDEVRINKYTEEIQMNYMSVSEEGVLN